MNKYKLTPIDLNDPCWAQCHKLDKEPIEVEAEDEEAAREAASHAAAPMQEGQLRNPISPWDDPKKTACELLTDEI